MESHSKTMFSVFESSTPAQSYSYNSSLTRTSNYTRTARFPPPRYQISQLEVTLYQVNYYTYPLLILLGSIGNILAYLVFTKTRLRKVSSVHYLAAIAITDTGFLWTFFLTVLQIFYNQPLITYIGVCQLVMFLNYGFTFLSIWYMVALVVDRFIALCFSSRKSSMCTVFRARVVIVGIGALAVVCYSYITYFYGVNTKYNRVYCGPFSEFDVHYKILDQIDIVVVAVIPYIVIIVLVVLIGIYECVRYRISASSGRCSRIESGSRTNPQNLQPSSRIFQIVCPVIVVTVLFNPPQNVMRTLMRYSDGPNPALNKYLDLCRVFYLLNFALKGFLYLIFSETFRKRLKEYICECRSTSVADPQVIRMEEGKTVQNGKTGLIQTAI